MPVHLETTSAISSSVTLLRSSVGAFDSGLLRGLELLLQLRNLPVLQLGHAREIAGAARRLEVEPGLARAPP